VDDQAGEDKERDPRDEAIANAKQPAGFEPDGRDETLTSGDLVHPSGLTPGGHTTPPGTALPDEPEE
jgi:hypothetical protein